MIMEAIFGGDMYPLENIVPQQDGYKAEVKAIAGLMDELANKFSKADFSKVEELHQRMTIVQQYESTEHFKCGLSTGLLLMKEAYEYVARKYDSFQDYLAFAGVDENTINKVKNKLLD